MTKEQLHEKAMLLPQLPGVYLMRDGKGEVIYVGKAKRLRDRVSQYFRDGVDHDDKVRTMASNARNLDVIVTQSEYEALVLEASQIKQYQPRYNVLLKDDKGYSYVKITNEAWPRISAELQKDDEDARYLGPYMSSYAVRQLVQTVSDSFLLPRCNRRFPEDFGKERPCLYAHINKCMAVCTGNIPHADYLAAIDDAIAMIRQGKGKIVADMRRRMKQASKELEYEKAALLRDQINAIEKVSEGQTVVRGGDRDQDVIAFAQTPGHACAAILRLRDGRLMDKREFLFKDTDVDALRETFVPQYYLDPEREVPHVVAIDAPLADQTLLQQALSDKRGTQVKLYTPERGDNRRLIEMAYLNAVERLARESGRTQKQDKMLDELSGLLGLVEAPDVIESYDISNWGDGTSVCGMVVFENGKPKKSGYRRFKIKTVPGTDDYASMAEALSRRAARYEKGDKGQFGHKPDLILLDGGQGQVNAVGTVLANTQLADVPLFGMVKDSRHRTRGLVNQVGEELELAMHKGVFHFVSTIQNEVHRFAQDYQRRDAKKTTYASTLQDIPGVGPKTAQALMREFKTLGNIKKADLAALEAAKGVTKPTARNIHTYFEKERGDKPLA